jgi:hypothetical protein
MDSNQTKCTCREIKLGSKATGSYDWNETCLVHGLGSEWYHSPEQVEKRLKTSQRLRDLWEQRRQVLKDIKVHNDKVD